MKKTISLVLAFMIGLSVFGCSNETATQKTEEEIRAEVKAEMEAEEKQKEELNAETEAEQDNQKNTDESASLDVRNNDAVYEFINVTYPNKYTREDFDKWMAYYMDITQDGNEEVVFTTTYGEGSLEKAIFITSDGGKYKVIPSDIGFAKYQNDVAYLDGFITFMQKSGGSGAHMLNMSIYVFDGSAVKYTGASLVIENVGTPLPGSDWKNKYGEIDGNDLTDFVFVISEEDINTETLTPIEKTRYIYDESTMTFNTEVLSVSDMSANTSKETVNDYTKGIEAIVRNNSVYIKYVNTGNEVEVYNINTTKVHKNDGNGVFTFNTGEVKSSPARYTTLGNNGKRLYITTNLQTGYSPNSATTYYVDLATLDVTYVGTGDFVKHVTEYPYNNYTILATDVNGSTTYYAYDNNNLYPVEIGVSLKDDIVAQIAGATEMAYSDAGLNSGLEGFTAETLKNNNEDLAIDYSDYRLVVVPMQSTINHKKLTRETCSFADNPDNVKMTFAIFGELQDIKVTYYAGMDSEGEVEEMGTLKNTYVDIFAPMPNDMSTVKVTGKFHDGEGYYIDVIFSLDDMRDVESYEILRYK